MPKLELCRQTCRAATDSNSSAIPGAAIGHREAYNPEAYGGRAFLPSKAVSRAGSPARDRFSPEY
jgi:hypothetical protein